jgi:hypothetical protein
MIVVFRASRRALAVVPKSRSWCGREVFEPSRKLINQLPEEIFGLAVLNVVSLTDIGTSPVDSVTAKAMAFESTRTRVYSLDEDI